jgi:hypothetical protein
MARICSALDPVVSQHGNIPVHEALLCVAPLMELKMEVRRECFQWHHLFSLDECWAVASDCTVLELYAVKLEHRWSPSDDGEPR